jgi:hypothetical protein
MSICDRPLLPIYGAYDAHGLRLLLNGISTFERSTLVDTPGPVPAKTTLAAQNELETPAQTSAAEVAKALAPAEPKRLSLAGAANPSSAEDSRRPSIPTSMI